MAMFALLPYQQAVAILAVAGFMAAIIANYRITQLAKKDKDIVLDAQNQAAKDLLERIPPVHDDDV